MTNRRTALVALMAGLMFTGSAAGFAAARIFDVNPGQRADFVDLKRSAWQCSNLRAYVTCQSGDAFPYVKLGGGAWPCGCVTVKVYTLRDPQGGHIIRTYERGYPVYIFRAS